MGLANNKLVGYLKESKVELKKVAWPTKKQTKNHSLLVIGISLAVAAFLGIIDYFLTIGVDKILR